MRNSQKLAVLVLMSSVLAASSQAQRARPGNASAVSGPKLVVVMNENVSLGNAGAGAATVVTSVAPMVQNVTRGDAFEAHLAKLVRGHVLLRARSAEETESRPGHPAPEEV